MRSSRVLVGAVLAFVVTAADAGDTPTATVEVRVLSDVTKKPVAGARIYLRSRDVEIAKATTDAAGVATIAAAWSPDAWVEASAEGFGLAARRLPITKRDRDAGRLVAAPLELTLRAGSPVFGRVLDATTGEPIGGARVFGSAPSSGGGGNTEPHPDWGERRTDAEGRFRFEGLDDGNSAWLRVLAAGHACLERSFEDRAVEQVFRLERAATIRGRVLRCDGTPWAGASLEWWSEQRAGPDGDVCVTGVNHRCFPRTDAAGRFEFPYAAFGLRHSVSVKEWPERFSLQIDGAKDAVVVPTTDRPAIEIVLRPAK